MMMLTLLLAELTAEFALGAIVGATLLGLAAAAGFWLGRRHASTAGEDHRRSEEMVMKLAKLTRWSRGLAEEMSQYGSVVSGVSQLFSVPDQQLDLLQRGAAVGLMSQVVEANERLKRRLSQAEQMLQEQADEITAHMSEARTDPLTGLPNRRAFDEGLARMMAEYQRHGTTLSVLTLDIDYFKQVNDSCGHQVGDEVLSKVARKLRQTMRESDLVARVGGEEMAVILARSDLDEARQAARRARQGIEQMKFTGPHGDFQVTVSIGVAQCGRGETGPEMVRRADEALYAAKHAGRNRAYWHDGEQCRPNESICPAAAPATSPPTIPDGADSAKERDFSQVCEDLRRRLSEVMAEQPDR